MCNRGDLLVSYIYDEISDRDRRDVEAHLASCAECRAEIDGLRLTRGHLAQWAPPQPELGFRIVRGGAEAAPALPRRRLAPAFAFAAAAVIVLAAAASLANIEVRYDPNGGVTLRTGWGRAVEPQLAATAPAAEGAQPAAATSFDELDRRLGELERTLAASTAARPGAPVQQASLERTSEADILRQVRAMLRDSEARQQTGVAEQLLQVVRDFDRQRRTDLALIQQGLGQYQTLTNAEIASQQLYNRLGEYIRANSKQEK